MEKIIKKLTSKKFISSLIVFIGLCVSLYQNFNTILSTKSPASVASSADSISSTTAGFYKVTEVVDGDTIKVASGTQSITVRLIGINTPEVATNITKQQCFGPEASAEGNKLLSNRIVRLEPDESQDTVDKYGRMLAYVYRDDNLFYNEYMIQNGFAREYTYKKAYSHQKEFKADQKEAKTEQKGLWSISACGSTSTTKPRT